MSRIAFRLAGGFVALACAASVATAAERKVLVEEFTATWCGPCENAGRAMSQLIDNFPGELVSLQEHISDDYTIAWSETRANFYGVTGIPTTAFDGVTRHVGAGTQAQTYNTYLNTFNVRRNVPTDVTIEIGGEEVGTDTYRVTVRVGVETTGQTRDMRLHVLQILDHYPSGVRHRECVIQDGINENVTLNPGETATFTHDFVLAGPSANPNRAEDVSIVAFAREQGNPWPREVYNAEQMHWPFEPLGGGTPGDVDGDGDVDLSDLTLMLAAYGSCDGDPAFLAAADIDESGCIELGDLTTLLSNYGS